MTAPFHYFEVREGDLLPGGGCVSIAREGRLVAFYATEPGQEVSELKNRAAAHRRRLLRPDAISDIIPAEQES